MKIQFTPKEFLFLSLFVYQNGSLKIPRINTIDCKVEFSACREYLENLYYVVVERMPSYSTDKQLKILNFARDLEDLKNLKLEYGNKILHKIKSTQQQTI